MDEEGLRKLRDWLLGYEDGVRAAMKARAQARVTALAHLTVFTGLTIGQLMNAPYGSAEDVLLRMWTRTYYQGCHCEGEPHPLPLAN